MIEKLKVYEETPSGYKHPENIIQDKINALVDAVNELQHDNSEKANHQENVQPEPVKVYVCADGSVYDNESVAKSHAAGLPDHINLNSELAHLQKENSNLKDEVELLQKKLEMAINVIRTRKALDVALDWLEQVATPEKCDDDLCCEFTKRKLAEIKTALEQKDK